MELQSLSYGTAVFVLWNWGLCSYGTEVFVLWNCGLCPMELKSLFLWNCSLCPMELRSLFYGTGVFVPMASCGSVSCSFQSSLVMFVVRGHKDIFITSLIEYAVMTELP